VQGSGWRGLAEGGKWWQGPEDLVPGGGGAGGGRSRRGRGGRAAEAGELEVPSVHECRGGGEQEQDGEEEDGLGAVEEVVVVCRGAHLGVGGSYTIPRALL